MPQIQWVIVGGESGPGAREMKPEWVRALRDECAMAGVAFFFKQWGGVKKKEAGRILDGETFDQLPAIAEESNASDDPRPLGAVGSGRLLGCPDVKTPEKEK